MIRGATFLALLVLILCAGCDDSKETDKAKTGAAAEFVRDPAAITGIAWEWVSTTTPVERTVVEEPGRYTILLQPSGKLEAQFDCNRGGGDYEIAAGRLSFGPMFSTRIACPPDSLDAPFMRDLERVTSFFVRDGELFLEMPVDSGTLRFRKASPASEP